MSLSDFVYRKFTYIAGDWDADKDAVDQLHKWNEGKKWGLSFKDIHEQTSSRDSSLNCTIKESLRDRMKLCKTFVIIVGEHTRSLTGGSCGNCSFRQFSLSEGKFKCLKGKSYDSRGYVDYECDLAIKLGLNIIVLYKGTKVDKSKCPDVLKNVGQHIAMKKYVPNMFGLGHTDWDYDAVNKVLA